MRSVDYILSDYSSSPYECSSFGLSRVVEATRCGLFPMGMAKSYPSVGDENNTKHISGPGWKKTLRAAVCLRASTAFREIRCVITGGHGHPDHLSSPSEADYVGIVV
jgi:hypothetical protein